MEADPKLIPDYRPPQPRRLPAWLTRENVVGSAKTLLWVAPLTALIWIYAEREQIIYPAYPNVSGVPVQITTSNPRSWFVEQSGAVTINLKLTGPQASIEQVRDELVNKIPRGLSIDLGDNLNTGPQRINIKERIENRPVFKLAGVTVEDCQPADLTFNVDQVIEKSVDVQVPPPATPLAGPPVVSPAQVQIRGPKNMVEKIRRIDADLAGFTDTLKPGLRELNGVPLTTAQGLQVTPSKVDIKLVVGDDTETRVLTGVPISIGGPPTVLSDYDVFLDVPTLVEVTVRGPKAAIEQLDKQLPHAWLEVSRDDYPQPTPKRLLFVLPDGVHESKEDHDRKFDKFRLVKKANTPA